MVAPALVYFEDEPGRRSAAKMLNLINTSSI